MTLTPYAEDIVTAVALLKIGAEHKPSQRFVIAAVRHARAASAVAALNGELRKAHPCSVRDEDNNQECLNTVEVGEDVAGWWSFSDEELAGGWCALCPSCLARSRILRQRYPLKAKAGAARAALIRAYRACRVAAEER